MLLDNTFPPDERVEKESISLIEDGFHVTVLCLTHEKDQVKEETYKGIKIKRIYINKILKNKIHPLVASMPVLYRVLWLHRVLEEMDKNRVDYVHVHDLPLCSIGSIVRKKKEAKFIADLHENFPALISTMSYKDKLIGKIMVSVPAWYRMEIKWLSNADHIIVTAQGMRDRLKGVGLERLSYHLIENTVKLNDFAVERSTPDPAYFTLFYSGGITSNRGLDVVLDALAQLKHCQNLRFWIVGDGKHVSVLKSKAKDLKLDNVTFWGWKTSQEMFRLMTESDLCIIPHRKSEHTDNTSPNKIFQYFYAKKPVLVSNCKYLEDLVNKVGAGVVFKDNNPKSLATRLEYLMNEADLIGMAEKGYDSVQKQYNWSFTRKSLREIYIDDS